MERILEIKEIVTNPRGKWGSDDYEGFEIVTNKQSIKLLIDAVRNCCESWGYFMSEDDINSFVGSEFIGLTITDTELKEGLMKSHDVDYESSWFEGGVMFVNIETTNGTLQFVAYNEHNGYYGHQALVISEKLNYEDWL